MTRDEPVAEEPLAQKLDSLQEITDTLENPVSTLESEKKNLREENQHLRNRVEVLEETVETTVEIRHQKEIQRLNGLVIGEDGLLTDEQEAFVEDEALIDHLRTTVAQRDDLESLR